jgi:hypothetical protein
MAAALRIRSVSDPAVHEEAHLAIIGPSLAAELARA